MRIEYDSGKNQRNIAERGLSFELVTQFEWHTAKVRADNRKDYGEQRYIATGYICERLCVIVFTPRRGALRIISLRKANKREVRDYEKTTYYGFTTN